MSASSERRFKTGDLIGGRYRLETALGAGGFGAVYRATQVSSGGGAWGATGSLVVALKLLHPDVLAEEDGRERFRREALLAQRLVHPNVVRLHDFGETEGVPFIAFEILHGKSLDVVLRQERALAHPRVLRITLQVLKALMAAHAAGIVHRDIKPANVFLCDFQGEPDFVKVLDFGIAKSFGVTSMAEMTRTGQIVGTPAYMSPEMLRENAASPAADIYALGLTMIRMISGELAYKGTPAEVIHGQLSPEPVPLPALAAQSPLAPVIRRAVEKNPSLRYADAAQMIADVQRVTSAGASFAAESMSFALPSNEAPPTAQPFVSPSGPSASSLPAVASTPTRPATPGPSAPPQTSLMVRPSGSAPQQQPPTQPQFPTPPQLGVLPSQETLPTRPQSSPLRLVLLGVTLTLVAGGVGIAVASVLLDRSDARTIAKVDVSASVTAPTPTTPPKQLSPDDVQDMMLQSQLAWNPPPDAKNPQDDLPTADARVVRQRLEAEGWQVNWSSETTKNGFIVTTSLTAALGETNLGATILVYPTVEQTNHDASLYPSSAELHTTNVIARRTILLMNCNACTQQGALALGRRLVAPPP
jgi:serine/threonine-protein kinase